MQDHQSGVSSTYKTEHSCRISVRLKTKTKLELRIENIDSPCALLFSITISELNPMRSGRFGVICNIFRLLNISLNEFSLSFDNLSESNLTWSHKDIDTIESVSELMFL